MFSKAYTFLDTKTGLHSLPFFVAHEGHAYRAAVDLGMDPNTTVGRHPSDFVLLRIGEFDDNTGQLHPAAPVNLGVVSAITAAHNPPAQVLPLFNAKESA